MSATITPGHCKICHEPVNKIHEPKNPVLRIDGIRFQYVEGSPFHNHPVYAIFSCEGCGQVIHDNWRAGDASTPPMDALARAMFEFRKVWPAGPNAPHEYAAAGFKALIQAREEMDHLKADAERAKADRNRIAMEVRKEWSEKLENCILIHERPSPAEMASFALDAILMEKGEILIPITTLHE